jgi:predicted ribosome quality control (RQC) complex YloA/Tae2 family protein
VLSLEELRRAVPLLERRLRGHRVQSIAQPDATSIVFTTYGGGSAKRRGAKHHLRLSCRPGCARVGLLEQAPAALPTPPAFSQYLRARVMNAEIVAFRLIGDDRQLAMGLRAREGDFEVLLAIFGRRSDVLLLDAQGCVAAAMRPLADTRPELALGEKWSSPSSKPPSVGEDRFADVPDERFLYDIEETYAHAEERGQIASLRRDLERVLRKEVRAQDRKLAKIAQSLAEAEKAAGLEREGELLKAVLARVKRGDARVVARDFTTGEEVAIALDPTLSPAENLERIFKRYQKAVRSLAKAGAQREKVRAARDQVATLGDELRVAVRSAESDRPDALEDFAAVASGPGEGGEARQADRSPTSLAPPLRDRRRTRGLGGAQRRGERLPDDAPGRWQRPLLPPRRGPGQPRDLAHRGAPRPTVGGDPGRL